MDDNQNELVAIILVGLQALVSDMTKDVPGSELSRHGITVYDRLQDTFSQTQGNA